MKSTRAFAVFLIVSFFALIHVDVCPAQDAKEKPRLVVETDHINGLYQVGDVVHWKIKTTDKDATKASYSVKSGELVEVAHGEVDLVKGEARLETRADAPGHLMIEVHSEPVKEGESAVGGALVAPEKIGPSAPRPKDFDSFWALKLREVAPIPPNAQLEPRDAGDASIKYWRITMDNINGTHIHGQLACPAQGEKFPALLIVQWAGVYSLQTNWVADRARQGWLVLNIEPHDMEIDAGSNGAPANYASLGNNDRDKSYYVRMFLSCCQAARYLTQRPDWNHQTLVVMGDSQGGQQTLVTASLVPKVTAAIALVPGGADALGPDAGRRGGYPRQYENVGDKDPKKVREASRYFDTVNFTHRIRCPVLVGLGLIDDVCPPTGIVAAFNQIKSPKQMMVLTHSAHQNVAGSQEPFWRYREEWLKALKEGQAPPTTPKILSDY